MAKQRNPRFVAQWFLGSSNGDTARKNTLEELVPFVQSRIADTASSRGGIFFCVADTKSKSESVWLWQMESGGRITVGRGKYATIAAKLFGGPNA